MSKKRSRDFLKECVESPRFADCTGNALAKQCRMVDREVVLRFMAFSLLDTISDYRRFGSMEEMLWQTTKRIDDPDDVTYEMLMLLREGLFQGLELSELAFGEHAFRKRTRGSSRRSPFNRALFETWTYGLAARNPAEVERAATEISEIARARMSDDVEYMSAITSSTSTLRKVEYRFSVVTEILDEALA